MKLSHKEMITMNMTMLTEPGGAPAPLFEALITAHGLPVAASIRLRTIMDRIGESLKRLTDQRAAVLRKLGVRFNETGDALELDPEGAPAGGIEGDLVALANGEIEALLAVEVEGFPPVKASMLADSTERAAQLLVGCNVLGWLQPLIQDDLGK